MAQEFEPTSKGLVDWLSERTNRDNGRLTDLEIARLGKVWINPDQLDIAYQFKNSWAQAGDPYELFRYRLFDKDHLEFVGTITGGTVGTIAFRLLPPFLPRRNIIIINSVEVSSAIKIGHYKVDYTTGDVSVFWV